MLSFSVSVCESFYPPVSTSAVCVYSMSEGFSHAYKHNNLEDILRKIDYNKSCVIISVKSTLVVFFVLFFLNTV